MRWFRAAGRVQLESANGRRQAGRRLPDTRPLCSCRRGQLSPAQPRPAAPQPLAAHRRRGRSQPAWPHAPQRRASAPHHQRLARPPLPSVPAAPAPTATTPRRSGRHRRRRQLTSELCIRFFFFLGEPDGVRAARWPARGGGGGGPPRPPGGFDQRVFRAHTPPQRVLVVGGAWSAAEWLAHIPYTARARPRGRRPGGGGQRGRWATRGRWRVPETLGNPVAGGGVGEARPTAAAFGGEVRARRCGRRRQVGVRAGPRGGGSVGFG